MTSHLAADASTFLPQHITLGDWLRAITIVAVSVVVAVAVRKITERLLRRGGSERLGAAATGRLFAYLIVVIGFVYALNALGARLGPLLGALGIGGLALALAAQDVLANFIDGVLIEARRPFRRGDQVQTNDHEGTVEDVNLRAVIIRTFDGQRVYVPNTAVLRNPIVNHTALGRRRTTLVVGVAYGTDLRRAKVVAMEAMSAVDGVVATPGAEAWVTEFGESTINLSLRFWHAPDQLSLFRVRDAVAVAVKDAYDAAGITIAFPQRVLWFAGDTDA